jgi:hypothetical protein
MEQRNGKMNQHNVLGMLREQGLLQVKGIHRCLPSRRSALYQIPQQAQAIRIDPGK